MQTATLSIPSKQREDLNQILRRTKTHPEYASCAVIATFTAKFPDGCEADIKVCNGEGPYVDPVLFDPNGHEIATAEVTDELAGTYRWDVDGESYQLLVS